MDTADHYSLTCALDLTLAVAEPLIAERTFGVAPFPHELARPELRKRTSEVIARFVANKSGKELLHPAAIRIAIAPYIEAELASLLEKIGLQFVSLDAIEFVSPELDELRKHIRGLRDISHTHDTKKASLQSKIQLNDIGREDDLKDLEILSQVRKSQAEGLKIKADARAASAPIEEKIPYIAPPVSPVAPLTDNALQSAVARHTGGVGVVIIGGSPVATAWLVAGRGIVATSAHVAARVASALEGGQKVALHFTGSPAPISVQGAKVHQRYGNIEVGEVIPGYDIGVLSISEAPAHPGLPLASRKKLHALTPGAPAAYLGFPVEGLAGGGVNLSAPQAIAKAGTISALVDWQNRNTPDPASRHLIVHDLALAGGASGSPLFDSLGNVIGIISAGNKNRHTDPTTGETTFSPSAALINFAQRIDILTNPDPSGFVSPPPIRHEDLQMAITASSPPLKNSNATGKLVFLSYSRSDIQFVTQLAKDLQAAGVNVWFDKNDLETGDSFKRKILADIGRCDHFVPVISEATLSRSKGFFWREWRCGIDNAQATSLTSAYLLPVIIDDKVSFSDENIPAELRTLDMAKISDAEDRSRFIARVSRLVNVRNKL